MTLGLYEIRTISTPPVTPKDAPKATLNRPSISLAEDARRCNLRAKRTWGNNINFTEGAAEKYKTRAEMAYASAEKTDAKVIAAMRELNRQASTPEIIAVSRSLSRETVRMSLQRLRDKGVVMFEKLSPNKVLWWIATP